MVTVCRCVLRGGIWLMPGMTYEALIQPIEGQMTRTIWRIVRDKEEASDTLQEALATIWKRMDRVCTHPNPQALILKICIDAAYDTLRKRRRGDRNRDETPEELDKRKNAQTDAPETRFRAEQTEKEVLDAIARLPKKQATAMLMRLVREESYETIAQVLGCKETTVRIHVTRGRAKLQKWLSHLKPSSITREVVNV